MVLTPFAILRKSPFQNFAVYYTTAYQAYIPCLISADPNHPLSIVRARKEKQKERSGLWWHVTVNHNACSTKVVRAWIARRLRTAFLDELRLRGIKDDGKLKKDAIGPTHGSRLIRMLQEGKELSLTGSLRLHCKPALITAKYEDVRQETGKVIDILLQGFEEREMEKDVPQTYARKFPKPRGQRQIANWV